MFSKPAAKPDFDALERAILQWWKESQILDRSIAQRQGAELKPFYDGPITANGAPHLGHMLTFSMKDVFPRYWTQQGYYVPRSIGWDCQGLPVELEVQKNLGIEKHQIDEFGIAKFNKECRDLVIKFRSQMVDMEERVGRLTNADEEYATMDPNYIESVWWSLKTIYEKGLLYEGFKVVPYSTAAGTSWSNAEVAMGGYKSLTETAVTVKFELTDQPGTFVLAWTTTPWTLPSNKLISVGKEIKYVIVEQDGSKYILAKDLAEKHFPEATVTDIQISDYVGKTYKPLFHFQLPADGQYQIVYADHVTTESGTGVVHLAPYGAEDVEILLARDIPVIDVLNDSGIFTDAIPKYAGQHYIKANALITADLEAAGLLFKQEEYTHDMPMCWRTGKPLIYRPMKSWFIAMSRLRDNLVANNETVNWVPEHMKEGRFGSWLREIKDWGLSRNRYWGTPLPVWKAPSGKVKVIGSFAELQELSGKSLEDPHRPFVDEVTFELEGETYTRVVDVIDVWYDSGSMPFARFHYPFENKEKFEQKFPALYVAEGVDQTRGWFYSLMAIATAVFDKPPFQNVVVNGFTLDDNGVKHSKSKKNYSPPAEVVGKYGADAVRLNFFGSPIAIGGDSTVSENSVKAQLQEFLLPLWNSYVYLTTYATLHNWEPSAELAYNARTVWSDEHPWDHIPFDNLDNELDAWILLQLQQTIGEVTKQMNDFSTPAAVRALLDLLNKTSKWYIRRSRERFASGELRALEVLYYVLVEFAKLAAPFIPFMSEHLYQELVAKQFSDLPESIHLTDFPTIDLAFIGEYGKLQEEMELVQTVSELALNLRTTGGFKVRQPLSKVEVIFSAETTEKGVFLADWMQEMIASEVNVLEVNEVPTFASQDNVAEVAGIKVRLDTQITPELAQAGLLRELTRQIQNLRKEMGLEVTDQINVLWDTESTDLVELLRTKIEEIKRAVNAIHVEQGVGESELKVNDSSVKVTIAKI